MQKLKAIIFDMDGTLADTEEIHRQAFNSAFDEFKLDCHWDQNLYKNLLAISGGRERIRRYVLENDLVTDDQISVEDLAIQIHTRKSEIYRQRLVDGHVGLRNGVSRLLHEAINLDMPLAIATSSSLQNVETLIKSALGEDALDHFKTIVTCENIHEQKPSPAIYKLVLEHLQIDPYHCIAIEDTYNGNQSALSAGIATIITTHMFTLDDNFKGASLVLNSLGEPDTPMKVISGNAHGYTYVTAELIDQLLEDTAG